MNLSQRFSQLFGRQPASNKNFAELTYVGHRDSNQDYIAHLFTPQGKLFIVADGLGGHQGGELASKYFCEALLMIGRENFGKLKKNPELILTQLTEQAANAMSDKMMTDYPGIKAHTTCAIAWLAKDNQLTTLHIGDSRIYWFTATRLIWRSRDHSVIQMKVDRGEITEQQMGTHPDQGALTRSIGVGKKVKPSCKTHQQKLKKGDTLLLCTDGFWERVSQNEILSLAKSKDADKDLNRWIKTAIERAKQRSDNVSAELYIH